MPARGLWAVALLLAAVGSTPPPTVAPSAPASPLPSPERVLGMIRAKFRSHRPPPPYITYTLVRTQKASNGFPDYVGSYTYHIWCRTSDRAALKRKVFRDFARGDLEFDRPAFNEARDPGPPTADVFEPAPTRAHPVSEVPTAEPVASALPVIGTVTTIGEFDYKVVSMDVQGSELHLSIEPTRTPERNRLREIFVDRATLELHKLIATDKLFVDHGPTYRAGVIITMGSVAGTPVITNLHFSVYDGYDDDGKEADFAFKDITFPAALPDWYFDPKTYAAHKNDAPQ
jgi:hypothetical protein